MVTPLPVIDVPLESKSLKRLDSLLSIVQTSGAIPVATVAIGGAKNAGLLAVSILGASDESIRAALIQYKKELGNGIKGTGATTASQRARLRPTGKTAGNLILELPAVDFFAFICP